jgi:hypothetical protein
MNKLAALVLTLAACKSGDKAAGKEGTAKTASGKGGCETAAKKPAELVAGKTPQLLAPLDKLSLGMSPAEAAKVCPNFFQGEDGKKQGTFSTGEIVGKFGEEYAQARLEFTANKLTSVSFALPGEIADALTTAWGAPKASSGSPPAHAWLDEASGMRAILEPKTTDSRRELVVSKFVPIKDFIDPESKTIAWHPQDVLGKQPAELATAFAQYVKVEKTSEAVKKQTDEMMKDLNKDLEKQGIKVKRDENMPEFELPASPFSADTSTHVILHTNDDGRVRVYGVWFRTANLSPAFGFPGQAELITKTLDELWGPHKVIKDTLGDRSTWFDSKRGVRVSTQIDKPEEVDLNYARYLPLATFFGAPGKVWGFEKPERPLLGATPDELVATYGKDFEVKHDAKAQMVTMSLPPTDYESDSGSTYIQMHLKGGKVSEWRTHIPFDSFEPAKAEYEALLATKLGKPKAKGDHFIYGKKPSVDAQYSKYTHELDIEVK